MQREGGCASDALDRAIDVEPMTTSTDEYLGPVESDSTTARDPRRWRALSVSVLLAFALPLALYALLRPENYGLTPNWLDPIFYSGYAINFDDMLAAVGDRHYFVSRWTVYYPMYVADRLFGPFAGRLLWRLVLAAAILGCIWSVGRWLQWNRAQQLLIAVLTLTMPMFVRAFFTDYFEYQTTAFGICLVCLCLRPKQTPASVVAIGTLAGSMLVAHPYSITSIGLPVLAALVLGGRSTRARALIAAGVVATAGAVLLGGLVLFRWRYGIDNVYEPTVDFIRSQHNPFGPFRSPRLDWLTHYTWLYTTPFVLLVAAGMAWRRHVSFTRTEVVALAICGLQYTYQWLDQFALDAVGLEVPYYWSFSLPTLAVAVAVVVARATEHTHAWKITGIAAGWLALLLIGVPDALELPSGTAFLLLAAALAVAAAVLTRQRPTWGAAAVLAIVAWMQIGAPHYKPWAFPAFNSPMTTSPHYDELFRESGNGDEITYDEIVWFAEEMDRVASDASMSFVPVGGKASPITGLYAPHVTGRLVATQPSGTRLTRAAISEIRAGVRPIVAVYGPPKKVGDMVATFPADLGVGTRLLDVTNKGAGLGYRLVVFAMPDRTILPFTWKGALLPSQVGQANGTAVTAGAGDAPGFVTFGPYMSMTAGTYEITLDYSSSAPAGTPVGVLDVYSSHSGTVAAKVDIVGTAGKTGRVSVRFKVPHDSPQWEFRTLWNGTGSINIDSLTLGSPGRS